jgi:tRNA-guanine family transglycosylase
MPALHTSRGSLPLPAFLPVTTFGGKFPLDNLLRHYLEEFCPAIMVSHHYAQAMEERWHSLTFIDSGGFASLFQDSSIVDLGDRIGIQTRDNTLLDPANVLSFQHHMADIGATLDFLIPPSIGIAEAEIRQQLTIKNALWAVTQPSSPSLALFASVQAWDPASARSIMNALTPHPFAGFALGGMVPRISNPGDILNIVDAIREADTTRPLHVFGVGSPVVVRALFDHGVDSVDSSSYVRAAVSRQYVDPITGEYLKLATIQRPGDLCPCRVCQTFDVEYLLLEGELNTMSLALHNLAATLTYLRLPIPHLHGRYV